MSEFSCFTSTGIESGSIERWQSGGNSGQDLKLLSEAYEVVRPIEVTTITLDAGNKTVHSQANCSKTDRCDSSAESPAPADSSNAERNVKVSDQPENAQSSDGQCTMRIKSAIEAFENALRFQNHVTAEKFLKEAINEADKLDTSRYKSELDGIKWTLEHLTGKPEGIAQCTDLLALKKQYEATIDLPQELRFQLVRFYLKFHKHDEARAILEDMTSPTFKAKYPECEKSLSYKALKEFTDEWCQSSIDKAVKALSKESQSILTDFVSGGLGAAVYAMNPQAALRKRLLLGLGTGALSKVGLEAMSKEGSPSLQAGAWGAFNAGVFISCGETRASILKAFARSAETPSELFFKRLVLDTNAVMFGSLMYRGVHNAANTFDQNNPLSVRQAIARTMAETTLDTMWGASLLLAGRGLKPGAYIPESLSPFSAKLALQAVPSSLSFFGRTQLGLKALPFAASMFSGPLFEAGLQSGWRVDFLRERELSQLPLKDSNSRLDPLAGSHNRRVEFMSSYYESKLKLDEILSDLQQKNERKNNQNDLEMLKSTQVLQKK